MSTCFDAARDLVEVGLRVVSNDRELVTVARS